MFVASVVPESKLSAEAPDVFCFTVLISSVLEECDTACDLMTHVRTVC